ncbi:hypothetical protein BJX96DRAFT_146471 [Aspergillus floccosus]
MDAVPVIGGHSRAIAALWQSLVDFLALYFPFHMCPSSHRNASCLLTCLWLRFRSAHALRLRTKKDKREEISSLISRTRSLVHATVGGGKKRVHASLAFWPR